MLKTKKMSFVNKLLICVAVAMEIETKPVKNLYRISKYSLSKKTSFYSKILICNFKQMLSLTSNKDKITLSNKFQVKKLQ